MSGLDGPPGLAFHKGYLYIANEDGVVRVQLDAHGSSWARWFREHAAARRRAFDANDRVRCRQRDVRVDGIVVQSVHRDATPSARRVVRFNEDGSNGRVFARGLRNAVGLAIEPTTQKLWVSQNERDDITPDHQNLPPEEINILQDGKDYGWPYCYSHTARRCRIRSTTTQGAAPRP